MRLMIIAGSALLVLTALAVATPPALMNYQGVLVDSIGDHVADGDYLVTFTIWDSDVDGDIVWREFRSVSIANGAFMVLLGSVVPLNDLVFADSNRYLGIAINTDPEMSPRAQLVTVPYAFKVATLDGATSGTIKGGLVIQPSEFVSAGNAITVLDSAGNVSFTATVGGNGLTVQEFYDPVDFKDGYAAAGNKVRLGIDGVTILGASDADTTLRITAQGQIYTGSATLTGINSIALGARCWANGDSSTVAGGYANMIHAQVSHSFIGGGFANDISATAESKSNVIGGGEKNWIFGSPDVSYSSVLGGRDNYIGLSVFKRQSIAAGDLDYCVIAGGFLNSIDAGEIEDQSNSAIVGGGYNKIENANYAIVGGGVSNKILHGAKSCILGGRSNRILNASEHAAIGGGYRNTISGATGAFIGGGGATPDMASDSNLATGAYSAILGGSANYTTGGYGVVAGGHFNEADSLSFAAGKSAKATHLNSFVWSDGSATTNSTANSTFTIRASGGVTCYTATGTTTGVTVGAGSGAWSSLSDSTVKRNIREVDYGEILEKIGALPISRWSYESQDESIEHIGPMAQDFYRLFGVGDDERRISTLDPDGVALAAIKALNDRVKALEIENAGLKSETHELKAQLNTNDHRLEQLESMFETILSNVNSRGGEKLSANR